MAASEIIIGLVIFIFIAVPTVLAILNFNKDRKDKDVNDLSKADNLNRYTREQAKKQTDNTSEQKTDALITIKLFAYPQSIRGLDDITGKIMGSYRDSGDFQSYDIGGAEVFTKVLDAELDKAEREELTKLTTGAYEVRRINDGESLYFYTNSRSPQLKTAFAKEILAVINGNLEQEKNVLMNVKRSLSRKED